MKPGKLHTLAAAVAVAMMAAAPVGAKNANSLRDLVGSSAFRLDTDMQRRGFEATGGNWNETNGSSYWWHRNDKDCVAVEVNRGRVSRIRDARAADCGHKGNNNGTAIAAAAVGALALGAILLSRKDRDSHREQFQQDWQMVEVQNTQSGRLRIFRQPNKDSRVLDDVREGARLRNFGCENHNGESWCEVSTLNGRSNGWARDRYLRPSN